MFFFYDWLYGQPDGYEYNYGLRQMIPLARFAANTEAYDTNDFYNGIASTIASNPADLVNLNTLYLNGYLPSRKYVLDTANFDYVTNQQQRLALKIGVKERYFYLATSVIRDVFVESEVIVDDREAGPEPYQKFYNPNAFTDLPTLFNINRDWITKGNYRYSEEIALEVIRLPHVTFSDHQSFVQYQYAASYLWQYATSPYYHNSEDTLDHMNITYLAKVCKLTIGTLASMAELHPHLTQNDLSISIKGSLLASPCQFIVRIENKKPQIDTANVTINIALRNLWTNQYVLVQIHTHTLTCNWTFTEEIQTVWEFQTMGRQYPSQCIALEVTIRGIKDDVSLYAAQRTIGAILGKSIYLIPTY